MDLRNKILGAPDLVPVPVPCPEWDLPEGVFARGLTGTERDSLDAEARAIDEADGPGASMENRTARVVARGACDADGKSIFTPEDAAELGKKSNRALDRLFSVIDRLSSITRGELDALLGKPSGAASGSSGSGSPATSG